MNRIDKLVLENNMNEDVKKEIISILNDSLVEIGRDILNKEDKTEKVEQKIIEKRFKSRKAEEFAGEHELTLDDFNIAEVSKKDVENKVREITKSKNHIKGGKTPVKTTMKTSSDEGSSSSVMKKVEEKKREKVICSGINKKGEACKSTGTIQPEGAKKKYCFRHAEDFRSFECDTDSSEEENEEEGEYQEEQEDKHKKDNDDDEEQDVNQEEKQPKDKQERRSREEKENADSQRDEKDEIEVKTKKHDKDKESDESDKELEEEFF